ncbi:MAG TPA: murein biosynthesis integral membrane protein MurJ [Deltaproteobacteria bacterium]|nr:murein biosynthesis integral membrane protein MurJ [Deltaproteobacteria bacterium]
MSRENKLKVESQSSARSITDIIQKGSVITLITLVSRPLGYVREAIQAYLFGATLLVDAFIVAFNFPELIQTLFFSGATSAFLIPVCSRYLHDDKEYSEIYSTFINLSLIITLIVSIIFFVLSGIIAELIGPGFNPETKKVTQFLFVIMIPVISLHTLLSIMKAFLNAKEHFAAPEMSGIIWNLAFIFAAIMLSKKFGIYSLAIGVTVGSFLQILIQFPYLKKFHIRYKPKLSLDHPAIKEAKNLFTGALIATSIVPINSFVGRVLGSYLPHGEVAALSYAFRIFILPFSLFAVPVYTVMFSKISRFYHDNDWKRIFINTDSSIILLCITLIPSTILLCSMGDVAVKILYERGAFTPHDTLITNRALFGYSIGLLFYALSISLVRIFNAFHDTKTPAIVGITSIVINAILASFLMVPLKNFGIALATSIVSFYNFVVLFIILKKKTHYRLMRRTIRDIIKSIIAGIILLGILFLLRLYAGSNLYIICFLSLFFTLAIYGIFFKDYYLTYLKR